MNHPVITFEVTKGRVIIISVKSQPPFDLHRQYLDVSLTDFVQSIYVKNKANFKQIATETIYFELDS